ncbi:hypothetical protein [Paraburkholderia sp. GAS348]|uniref:hypothetical protein n=1 Tax=Paraburkholderia sp. GAS348 TaxID=3035132 RepID=UPI003D20EEB6
MNAGSRAFNFFTPGGGLIGALFCPASGWKMATIAEIVFIRFFGGIQISIFAVTWKNVLFFAFFNEGIGVWTFLALCGGM